MVFHVPKARLVAICERAAVFFTGAWGGNEKVMSLFLPSLSLLSALLEKTDEPELANKVKTIRGEWVGRRETHARTHTCQIKRDVYSWKIDCVNIHFISAVQYVSS